MLLFKFVPRNRIREAHVSFLFKQLITWLFGLLVVEKNLISYPNRLFFRKANRSSFTFEYFVYPALCTLFNLYYPEKPHIVKKLIYYLFHTSIITVFETFAVKYTNLIQYKKWTWYWSFITVWLTYYLSRIYHSWFFKNLRTK
ncbi:CBO0543 family protein [Ornithinibacillus contaminans]|uniref:CBO0543 family protein n=1 Tax=Ornithinibacillus contaminans TaxID=694055 RepID=UPI002E8037F2|nr:CBO0543 family protein [Ornithinibacillus contaminans]